MGRTFSNDFENNSAVNATDGTASAASERLLSEASGPGASGSDATSNGNFSTWIEQTNNEFARGFLPQFELISNNDSPSVLPEGMQGTLVFEDDFQNSDNWYLGIQNTSGRGPGPENVWHGDQGFTFSEDAVTFGPDGLNITATAIIDADGNANAASTFGEISSREPVGGNGQPYYIEFTMTGGDAWPAVWLLPVDDKHGQKEIDLHEGNMPGNSHLDDAEETLNSAYHWNFKPIEKQVLSVFDTDEDLSSTEHIYGALIEGDRVTIYFDGEMVGVLQTDDDNLDVPMTIIIDNYVWPGPADWHADNFPGATTMNMTNMSVYEITELPDRS